MNLTKKQANKERIKIAMTAVESIPDYEAVDLESGIIDLMTNLMHLAASEGLHPEALIGIALRHWEAER